MKKSFLFCLIAFLLLVACSNNAGESSVSQPSQEENPYYQVSSDDISIVKDADYEIALTAKNTWQFVSEVGDDVTAWLANKDASAALTDTSGVARIKEISDDGSSIVIGIDASKITGFTSNGKTDLYIAPTADAIAGVGDNHAPYHPLLAKIGEYVIPTITVDGEIEGEYTAETGLSFKDDTLTFQLTLDDKAVESKLLDNRKAAISLQEGDGYYASDYTFKGDGLSSDWSHSSATYKIAPEDLTINNGHYEIGENGGGRGWSELGGDGNGHYNLNFALKGLEYNGLPIANQAFKVHVYAYGRTFSVDNGSIYSTSYITWSADSDNNQPNLADQYSDDFILKWAVGIDASKLKADDLTLTMKSQYGDELQLKAGKDFTLTTSKDKTTITVSYIYWANAPVYTNLDVEINPEHLTWDTSMYQIEQIHHSYDIASIYVYNVMAGGRTGTQTWPVYGLDGLKNWQQLFHVPTYTLSYTNEDGKVLYYSAENKGSFVEEKDATVFDASTDVAIDLQGNTGYFTRRFNQTQDQTVDNITYTFDKNYSRAELAIKNPDEIEGVTVKPGYIIGSSWEEHLRWPWQDFINKGYKGGHS